MSFLEVLLILVAVAGFMAGRNLGLAAVRTDGASDDIRTPDPTRDRHSAY